MSRSSTTTTTTDSTDTEVTSTTEETSSAESTTTESTASTVSTVASTTSTTEDSSSTSTIKYYLPENKRIGIVRYFQLHPTGNATVDRALKMIYKNTLHTEREWEVIVSEFI